MKRWTVFCRTSRKVGDGTVTAVDVLTRSFYSESEAVIFCNELLEGYTITKQWERINMVDICEGEAEDGKKKRHIERYSVEV